MVQRAVQERGFREDVARDYLTRRIMYELSARHIEGMTMFRSLNRALVPVVAEYSHRRISLKTK
jgi:predicted solute-binding protein